MPTHYEADITRSGPLEWTSHSWDACNDDQIENIIFFMPTCENKEQGNVLQILEKLAGSEKLPWLIRHSERWLLNLELMSTKLTRESYKGALFVEPSVEFHKIMSDSPLSHQYTHVEYARFTLPYTTMEKENVMTAMPPIEISKSLAKFRRDYPDQAKVGFVMMQFGSTKAHMRILTAVQETLTEKGLVGVRADSAQYHDDLFYNILTFIYGSSFGVCIFERLETEQFNPNVSLEVGYMLALDKPVCLLKDKTLKVLPTDITGRLYREFDPQDPDETISPALTSWLRDKSMA